jgi:hypothetical protein
MQINMEPGGVIADTMNRLAIHGQAISPAKYHERGIIATEMARQADGKVNKELRESIIQSESNLGRVACRKLRNQPNRFLTTSVSLMGEGVGMVPYYDSSESDVLIGKIELFAISGHSDENLHSVDTNGIWSNVTSFSYHADILTSGRVVLNYLANCYCYLCEMKTGANQYYAEMAANLHVEDPFVSTNLEHKLHPFSHAENFCGKHELSNEQLSALRQHLQAAFPLQTDPS